MKNTKMILAWLMVIALMVMIYTFSSQVAEESNQVSKGVTEKIVEVINNTFESEVTVSTLNHTIRKSAHFIIYMILGFLLMNAMVRGKLSIQYSYIVSFLISVLYAISDEVHQHFVPGRGPGIKDVVIDAMGALMGITIFLLMYKVTNKLNKKIL